MIVQKQVFDENECLEIIKLNMISPYNWDSNDRKYKSKSILYNEETKWIFDKLSDFFEEATHYKILNLKEEIHFHTYIENNWFGKHNDTRDRRLFSVGVILNSDFDGGEFKIYTPQEITLNKNVGNAYVFNVSYEHEITKIEKGVRHSLIWFIQDNHIKMKPISII